MMYILDDLVSGETRLSLEKMVAVMKSLSYTPTTFEYDWTWLEHYPNLKERLLAAGVHLTPAMEISLSDWPMSEKELMK